MKNYLESDESLKELGIGNIDDPKFSRFENFYTLDGAHENDLEECSIRIESISILGALREEVGSVTDVPQRCIRSNEKLSIVFPSVLSTSSSSGRCTQLEPHVWRAVMESRAPKASAPASHSNYVSMSDIHGLSSRYASLLVMHKKHQSELQIAREAKKKEALDAEETGPRTISQVRRGRQKDTDNNSDEVDVGLSSFEELEKNWIPQSFEDLARREVYSTFTAVSNRDVRSTSNLNGGVELGGACVVVSWIARFGGFTRRGMQMLLDVPVLSSTPSTVSSRSTSGSVDGRLARKLKANPTGPQSSLNIENRLSVTAEYEQRVLLEPSRKAVIIPIKLSVFSTYSTVVKLSVETVERNSSSVSSESPGPITTKSSQSSKGILWLGKCKYSNVVLNPFSSIDLIFSASVSKYGIVDLKRFKVTADISTDAGQTCYTVVKDIPGNYLVEIVDSVIPIEKTSVLVSEITSA
jgi:hypothetical protein